MLSGACDREIYLTEVLTSEQSEAEWLNTGMVKPLGKSEAEATEMLKGGSWA